MQIYGPDMVGGVNIEQFDELPPWSTERTGTLVYVRNSDTYYFGAYSEWLELPNLNREPGKYRLLGGTGYKGGTGATGSRGAAGPVGPTGGSGSTGQTGHTGGSGGSGGSGGTGGTGGTGATSGTGGTGSTGARGECVYGGTGDTGGTGNHGLVGTMLGDGDSSTLLCMVEVELRGQSGDEIGVQIRNIYNSFDVPYTVVSKGNMINDILVSQNGTTISIYPEFFETHNIKSTMPNLTFNNSLKEVQIYTNQYFDMRIFHPLDGKYQDITGWLDYGHVIRFQVMYVAARKICEDTEIKFVDFHTVALDTSFDYPYVENNIGFGGAGHTFDVQFIADIPAGYTYESIEFDFGTDDIIPLSNTSCKYTESGNYDVTMTVKGGINGDLQITKSEYIQVNPSLDASFSMSFLGDVPDQYPKRIQFHPVTEYGEHEWYFDTVNDPTLFSSDASPIVIYDEINTLYRITHTLTIDGRTVDHSDVITTSFNPVLDHIFEVVDFDEWRQTLRLRLTDNTDPDNVLLSWDWNLHEYLPAVDTTSLGPPKYTGIQGKTVEFDYELEYYDHYTLHSSFKAIGRDTNTHESSIKQLVFPIPFIERGILAGGQYGYYQYNLNEIWVVNPVNSANIILWATLDKKCQNNCGASNGSISDGVIIDGHNEKPTERITYSLMEKYKISTFAKTAYGFGRLSEAAANQAATSNLTNDKLVVAGGQTESAVNLDILETITISSASNQSNFGNLSQACESLSMSSNGTLNKGFLIGGYDNGSLVESIDTFNFESSGSVEGFSELVNNMLNACSLSNSTNNRTIICGGQEVNQTSAPINRITAFNAYVMTTTYFGNLYNVKTNVGGFSTGIGNHAYICNGRVQFLGDQDTDYWLQWNKDIEIVNIVSGANTELFGELSSNGFGTAGQAGMSNSI